MNLLRFGSGAICDRILRRCSSRDADILVQEVRWPGDRLPKPETARDKED